MTLYEMTQEDLEELKNIGIEELELSVRSYNAIRRIGFDTLYDLIFVTVEELMHLWRVGKKSAEEILEKLAERNITIPTEEEKQHWIEITGADGLRMEILALEGKNKRLEDSLSYMKKSAENEDKKRMDYLGKQKWITRTNAREDMKTAKNPIAHLIRDMYYGRNMDEGCSFCEILALRRHGCLWDYDLEGNKSRKYSCEECIEDFLADYYWPEERIGKAICEEEKFDKIFYLSGSRQITGRCPKCRKRLIYQGGEHFCARCGYKLNWDEENWDREMKEAYEKDISDTYHEDQMFIEDSIGDIPEKIESLEDRITELQKIEKLWEEFSKISNDEPGSLDKEWNGFPAGTTFDEILEWFSLKLK